MEKTFFTVHPSITVLPPRDEPDLHRAFEVRDDSMSDGTRHGYEPGDMLICRYLPSSHWWAQIYAARYDYVVIHRSCGALLRSISHYDPVAGIFILHSLNPCYVDFSVDIAEVVDLYYVIKVERYK